MPDLDAGEHLQFVGEDFARVEPPITVLVFRKMRMRFAQVGFELLPAFSVSVILGDPQSAARVPRHRNGVLHIRLAAKTLALKPVGNRILAAASGAGIGPRFIRLGVLGVGTPAHSSRPMSAAKAPAFHNADFSSGGEAAQ